VEPQSAETAEPVEPAAELAVAPPAPATPPKPNLATTSGLSLIRPVVGPVVIGFKQGAGRTRNDGIDFASPSGAPVVAAASGEVALVSQSLGGLGTIVLIRHLGGEFLTVYGRIEKVSVKKGDIVAQGQKIGVVSPSTQPRMHFEVRRGAESLDPEMFF
jgi:murein DD-endopeptidase MepM/ murein hydrolase activator NlpD